MRQLWLSYPALGSYIPNLGYFFASNNLNKMETLGKSLYVPRYHPFGHVTSKY